MSRGRQLPTAENDCAISRAGCGYGGATQAGGELNTKLDASGVPRPLSTSYQARVPLEDSENLLIVGNRGTARIYTGWQSLGQRLYRYVIRTFHFSL